MEDLGFVRDKIRILSCKEGFLGGIAPGVLYAHRKRGSSSPVGFRAKRVRDAADRQLWKQEKSVVAVQRGTCVAGKRLLPYRQRNWVPLLCRQVSCGR